MTDEAGFLMMERLLDQPQQPTAVLCASTALALGAIRSLNQRGLRPGRDISLIAHDDVLPLLKPVNFSVPLTTTRSSLRAAGMRVAERLIAQIKTGQNEPFHESRVGGARLLLVRSTLASFRPRAAAQRHGLRFEQRRCMRASMPNGDDLSLPRV